LDGGVMKALILSGGKGTRLYPITYTSAKQLVPVANRPVLFRALDAIVEAGITDVGIVVGDTAAEIMEAVGDGSAWRASITYIQQDEPLGLAHAVLISEDFLANDKFVMFLGDNVLEGGIAKLVQEFTESDWNSQIVLTKVPDPEHFGVAELRDGQVVKLVEKPKDPPSDLALVGIYMFDHHVFQAVKSIAPSWRGELEITDAIQYLVDQGYKVYPYVHRGWWIDTGKARDMLDCNRLLLEGMEPLNLGVVDEKSKLSGRVIIEKGAEIVNSTIRGPAIIGENTRIVDAYIGPYTAIYHDVVIENSEIEHCIILENSRITDIGTRIEDSVIGRNVEICRSPLRPKAYRMTIGDNSQIGIL
jgi:glucose-1-phosphate thymidylyltransferase